MTQAEPRLLLVVPKYVNTVMHPFFSRFKKRERENTQPNFQYIPPFGMAYISAAIKRAGWNLEILNLNHLAGSMVRTLSERLDSARYDFVLTGNNAMGYWTARTILDTARRHPSRPRLILGGPLITTEPEVIFNDLRPDFGVIGEGEETIVELLAALCDGRSVDKVRGLVMTGGDGQAISRRAATGSAWTS